MSELIKKLYQTVENYLVDKYNVNVFTQQGNRFIGLIYTAYITSDNPLTVMRDLVEKANKDFDDGSSYIAFQRSIYRELKRIYPDLPFINVVSLSYRIAKEIN